MRNDPAPRQTSPAARRPRLEMKRERDARCHAQHAAAPRCRRHGRRAADDARCLSAAAAESEIRRTPRHAASIRSSKRASRDAPKTSDAFCHAAHGGALRHIPPHATRHAAPPRLLEDLPQRHAEADNPRDASVTPRCCATRRRHDARCHATRVDATPRCTAAASAPRRTNARADLFAQRDAAASSAIAVCCLMPMPPSDFALSA